MTITERIKLLCDEKDTTFAAVERACDLSNGSIRRWEENKPAIDKLEKVADYFNVSVDYLLGRTNNPAPVLAEDFDSAFFKIMKEAQDDGISPHDLDMAINFLKKARERDKK